MMDVIASGCSHATSKGGAKLYKTMFWAERRDIYGGMYVFLHGDGLLVHCGYAEEPGCEKSYHGMVFFSPHLFPVCRGSPKISVV